ncbi:MAG: thioredoxin domain-containing protein [Vicinamibacterales bacterium]
MNRLASEASPYLRQHEDNPVDWFPWGEAAFERARREDRPIFLSIGYSTCHWCHVMAHESFENAEVAAVLNRDFVSVKLDREERPDIDRVYMAFVQASTGSGGWPMSVWLTPDLQPFYGGTYFPPTSRWGRPGFVDILAEIARAWREERGKVVESAATILGRLRAASGGGAAFSVPGEGALSAAVRQFGAAFDQRHGGFGGAPKFPRPSELLFLFREHARTGDTLPRDAAVATLTAMATGGLRDHLTGGFHRYSVDGAWRVPHFEKMLYDQAQLVLAYLEGAQVTGDPWLADIAIETLGYVERDLCDASGGFQSAEDADSVPPEHAGDPDAHGQEGAFYIWRDDELEAVLGADAEPFRLRFGCLPDGNAPSDPHGEFTGRNLLYLARPVSEVAERLLMTEAEVEAALARAVTTLAKIRASRPRPHRDDKVLTAWNGLMVAAFARAGRTLPGRGAHWRDVAVRAAEFLVGTMWDDTRQVLRRRFRAGDVAIDGFAEDYACTVWGLLELFQTTGTPRWLEWALRLQARMDALFSDGAGGWYATSGADTSVLVRMREDHDGAEPSATSVTAGNLLTLAHLTGDDATARAAGHAIGVFSAALAQAPRAVPMMLAALSTFHAGVTQVVVAGPRGRADTEALLDVLAGTYLPAGVQIPCDPSEQGLVELLPWLAPLAAGDGAATAFVCRGFTCERPTSDPASLLAMLTGDVVSG